MEQSPKKPFVKGYKYRIYPTDEQKHFLAKTFGACRFLYNKVLADTQREHQTYVFAKENGTLTDTIKEPNLSSNALSCRVAIHRNNPETAWLQETSAVALQQALIHLGGAYDRYFKSLKSVRKGRFSKPTFKKKAQRQSFNLMGNGFRLKDHQLYIAKLDTPLKVIWSRELPSYPTSLAISKTPSGDYYVSFTCEYTPQKTAGETNVGIDLGIKTYATLSTGDKLENPRWLQNHLKSLKRHQQSLSRKTKGSKNRTKARIKVAKLHQKVTNARHDWQHKATRTLVNNSHVIGVEALAVANMIRNRKLSKAIQDAAWSSFFQKLQYKVVESQHATLIYMSRFFPSSHICSLTGKQLERKLSLSERTWDCPFCGNTHDRDLNAAANIENKAMELYATLPTSKSHHGEVAVVAG